MAQQRLRRQHDQRLAQRTNHLTTQQVVDLRWRGRHAHLNVVLGAQLQVTLKTCRAVLRALAFVTVWQQHGQTAETAPLVLAAGDELVDHDLSTVGEVAELGFPDHQRVWRGGRVTVFECQYRFFREERVVQVETWLTVVQVLQRNVGARVFLVVQHSVTVRERTAADVLTSHADRVTFERQGRVRHGFGVTPVDRQAAGLHLLTVFVDLRDLTLNDEAFRNFQQLGGQFLQGLEIETRVVTRSPGVAQVRTPVDEQLFVRLFDQRFHHVQTVVQRVAVFVDLGLNTFSVEHTGLGQAISVQLTGGALLGDLLIHQGLGAARLVGLVVAATTVADQIDHHVTLELHAVVDGQLGHEQHGFRIITIHMEDRRLDHLGNVGGVLGGARVQRVADGETNLVVDHDVHGTAGLETAGLRHLEGFHDHALTGECRVTVDGDWQNFLTGQVVATVLTGAHRAFDHRGNDFQVGRVERHGQVNFTAGRHHVGREALVVFDVTGTEFNLLLAFELVEQLARVLAEGVDQYVQTATVGHADDDFLGAVRAGTLDQFVEHRNQAFAAFQTETLGARVFGAQVFFQAFTGSHALKQVALDVGGVRRTTTHAFQTLLEPLALLGIGDVREFSADGAAICLLQRFVNFA